MRKLFPMLLFTLLLALLMAVPALAADFTYDGLHPSDKGNEVIASLLAAKLEELLGGRLIRKED